MPSCFVVIVMKSCLLYSLVSTVDTTTALVDSIVSNSNGNKPSLPPGESLHLAESEAVLGEAGGAPVLPPVSGGGGGRAQQTGRAGGAGGEQVPVWRAGGGVSRTPRPRHRLSLQRLQVRRGRLTGAGGRPGPQLLCGAEVEV